LEKKYTGEFSNLPGIVGCAVIPLMGGWTFRAVDLKNPASYLRMNLKLVSYQDQSPTAKKK